MAQRVQEGRGWVSRCYRDFSRTREPVRGSSCQAGLNEVHVSKVAITPDTSKVYSPERGTRDRERERETRIDFGRLSVRQHPSLRLSSLDVPSRTSVVSLLLSLLPLPPPVMYNVYPRSLPRPTAPRKCNSIVQSNFRALMFARFIVRATSSQLRSEKGSESTKLTVFIPHPCLWSSGNKW